MARRIKIPKHLSHWEFDKVLSQKRSCEESLAGRPHQIYFDFSKTEYVSTVGVLLIADMADSFEKLGCKSFARYGSDEVVPWFMRLMGATSSQQEEPLAEFLDAKRVSVQRCWSAEQSRKAINEKLMPVIRQQYQLPETLLKALI